MAKQRLRMLFCDHLNLARGKYLPAEKMTDASTRLCQGVYAVTYGKDLIPAPGSSLLEGLHDMTLSYQADEMRDGWEPDTQVVIADQFNNDGSPLPMCGRGLLKRTVEQWRAKGLTPKVGIELEAYAFRYNDSGELVPYETPGAFVYSTGPIGDPLGFTDAVWHKASEMGFAIECMTSEFDSPQFEFTLKYDDAVKAVDDIFLFKQMAREVAYQQGVILTFMPKPIPDLGGNGVHINFSLVDGKGNNIILDETGEHGLSEIARNSIAGMMHHHEAMAGIAAPTVNSYERLQPASLSGYWKNWGVDHRGVTVRVANDSVASARIEHRMGDAGANPYTLTAAVLQAALLGVDNNYALQAPESQDCLESQDAETGLAESLSAALDTLESDTAFVNAMGEMLVGNIVGIKRAEIEEVAKLEGSAARDYYIHYI
ncbi:MAG: glutamine synthetase family protein [Pseudomonadota bacterium]